MSTDKLLARLDRVKKTGTRKWLARCPSHDDKGPSLAVKEEDDGRVLIHCFAGCGAADVLHSIGMTFQDLYPPKQVNVHSFKKVRKPWISGDIFAALTFEVHLVWQYAVHIVNGNSLTSSDRDRLLLAATRLHRGLEVCGHE